MPFSEAFEYFLAFQPHHSGVPTKCQKTMFREALLHEQYGLRISIVQISGSGSEYIVLRPDNIDSDTLFMHVFNDVINNGNESKDCALDKETIQGIISTMESEWDKTCLRVVLQSIYSRNKMQDLGFDSDNLPSMTARVKFVVEEVKNAEEAANDLVRLRLTSKKEALLKKINEKEHLYEKEKAYVLLILWKKY